MFFIFQKLKDWKTALTSKNSEIASSLSKFLSQFEFINPNHITFTAFFLAGIIGSLFILNRWYTTGSIFLLVGFWLDSIDGALAREKNEETPKGAVLDSVLDRYTDLLVLSSIALSDDRFVPFVLFAIIGFVMVPYIRARIEGAGFKASGTFGSREIRCFFLIAGLMFHLILPMLIFLGILSNASAIHRLYLFLKNR